MLHLKQTFGERLCGIMIYAHSKGSTESARAICYPFDLFFGVDLRKPEDLTVWKPVLEAIQAKVAFCAV